MLPKNSTSTVYVHLAKGVREMYEGKRSSTPEERQAILKCREDAERGAVVYFAGGLLLLTLVTRRFRRYPYIRAAVCSGGALSGMALGLAHQAQSCNISFLALPNSDLAKECRDMLRARNPNGEMIKAVDQKMMARNDVWKMEDKSLEALEERTEARVGGVLVEQVREEKARKKKEEEAEEENVDAWERVRRDFAKQQQQEEEQARRKNV
jgi:hypothetical protein